VGGSWTWLKYVMAWLIVLDEPRGDNRLRKRVSERAGVSGGKTNFAVIPGYIEHPLLMGTKKGFTPLSSPSTNSRAHTMPSDDVPPGTEGGMNLVQHTMRYIESSSMDAERTSLHPYAECVNQTIRRVSVWPLSRG